MQRSHLSGEQYLQTMPCNLHQCFNYEECILCINGYYFVETKCYVQCLSNQYNINESSCGDCSTECLQCTNLTSCLLCQSDYILYQAACYQKCAEFQYYNEGNCLNCGEFCRQCNATNCILCIDSFIPNGIDCICNTSMCELTCLASSDGCSICNGIYFFNNHQSTCDQCNLTPLQREPI